MKTILSKHSTKLSKIILLTGALIYFAFGFVFLIFLILSQQWMA
jgi:hypothetical protein